MGVVKFWPMINFLCFLLISSVMCSFKRFNNLKILASVFYYRSFILIIMLFIIAIQECLSHYPHLHWNGTVGLSWIFGFIYNRPMLCTTKEGSPGGGYFAKVIDGSHLFNCQYNLTRKRGLDLIVSYLFGDPKEWKTQNSLNLILYAILSSELLAWSFSCSCQNFIKLFP